MSFHYCDFAISIQRLDKLLMKGLSGLFSFGMWFNVVVVELHVTADVVVVVEAWRLELTRRLL